MNERKEVCYEPVNLAGRFDRRACAADPDRHGGVVNYPRSRREVWCSRFVGCAAIAALLTLLVL